MFKVKLSCDNNDNKEHAFLKRDIAKGNILQVSKVLTEEKK